ncbi:glycerate dehydrogenase [Caballeronia calidae]|uniref:Glycerate dehydrogenase n=1 Tax=Caballeronia calidae TaxID=1777139 RepID=A0A158BY71_9BURK|nr:D-2-hydroxyacid dehydrogenase [Caballeronia calidae]SAK75053.1 glycerate dehydrogenase [Caballeronia calidae]
MQKIVFLDRETLAPQITLKRPAFEHELVEYGRTAPEQVAARLQGASIVITNKVAITADIIEQVPTLRLVAVAATGTDVVDKAACAKRGIVVSNIRGYAVNTVPEHTFALMLALRRNLIAYRDDVLNGEWQKSGQFCFFNHAIRDLGGATLGIIGEGVLGQRVAEIAKAFGMKPVFAAHKGRDGLGPLYTPWDEVLATSDVITIHSPLTPQTRGMLSSAEFRAMKKKPLIINTARGGLVDEAALVEALDEGLISGIGFDVLTTEPPAADNALMRIANRPNVIVTPHVAWASDEAQQSLADQLMDNVAAFVAGTPVNVVS